jgi:hypothetical protein
MELSREFLIDRQREVFPSSLLTLVAIIQSLALAEFAAQCFENDALHLSIPTITQGLACLFLILVIWFQYQWAALMFWWPPKFVDSVIPFGIGLLESTCILAWGRYHAAVYCWSFAVICFAGSFAYQNTQHYVNTVTFSPDVEALRPALNTYYPLAIRHLRRGAVLAVLPALLSGRFPTLAPTVTAVLLLWLLGKVVLDAERLNGLVSSLVKG